MLPNEEYIEQAFFFDAFYEAVQGGTSTQEFLFFIRNELLATAKLPLAIDFLLTDMKHTGILSAAMSHIRHYFTPFQAFVIGESEKEDGRFDFRIALKILAVEAKYRSEEPPIQGLFFYQFETICRNRLGYDKGISILSQDDLYDDDWKQWLSVLRKQIGLVDLAAMIFYRSGYYKQRISRAEGVSPPIEEREDVPVLFGEREGRIAFATQRKDPIQLFAALSRHLGYPSVPHQKPATEEENVVPILQRRIEHLENRLQLMEEELRGGINLSRFIVNDGKK
jgi:hypothetical protein